MKKDKNFEGLKKILQANMPVDTSSTDNFLESIERCYEELNEDKTESMAFYTRSVTYLQ